MNYVLMFSAALGASLLVLLALASANTALFARHYPLLLGLNGALATALAAMVIYQLVALARQRRQKVFGSLLTFRVLVMFALVTVGPGALVYTVSVQFLAKSIDSWFDLRVDQALEGGLTLGRAALDALLADVQVKAGLMAADLAEMSPAQQIALIGTMREQVGADEALLLDGSARVVAGSARDPTKLRARVPAALLLRQARESRRYAATESHPDSAEKGLLMRVIVPLPAARITARFLQLTHAVPQQLTDAGENVQNAYHAYKELSMSRQGLKEIYILTLTLALLLALFAAIALALLLSRRLSQPLAVLAEGTQAVARGDFSRRAPVTSRDELGILTQSFNSMTEQLDEARSVAERNRAQLETAKSYLESILANLSAGVLVFDRALALRVTNPGAATILREDLSALSGLTLDEWPRMHDLARTIREEFREYAEKPWQHQIQVVHGRAERVILLRGSALPEVSGGGYVVVFDDITELISAQRATAWGEVARRLAHEIKNPLTPIQLSAERLQVKLAGRLFGQDAAALNRATETIVAQVTAMKNMVDDFRDYARTPPPVLEPLDINKLLSEVLALYESAGAHVVAKLGEALPWVLADRTQLRQVIHNLLQNAQDAMAGNTEPRIEVATRQAGTQVVLRISDNGCGFPEAIVERAFEPYITTKPKGTGLGLAIVKRIIDEHHGTIAIENDPTKGAAVNIALPLARAA
ncbi:MAG: HAMP domain-containing protein [Betaproteobacteria bacterium]|nr:HAMP domain-containing protein [Betaproteobacteria bacterium]